MLFILLHLYIKFQYQIERNKKVVKRQKKIMTDLISQLCQKKLYFLV
jgi:hypothetical protein